MGGGGCAWKGGHLKKNNGRRRGDERNVREGWEGGRGRRGGGRKGGGGGVVRGKGEGGRRGSRRMSRWRRRRCGEEGGG